MAKSRRRLALVACAFVAFAMLAEAPVASAHDTTGEATEVIGAGVPSIGEGNDEGASTQVILVVASGPHDGDVAEVDLTWGFSSSVNDVVLTHPDGVVAGELNDHSTVEIPVIPVKADSPSSAGTMFGYTSS